MFETLKKKLAPVLAKVVENKATIIQVGCVLAGAAIGSVVTSVIINAQNEPYLIEELLTEDLGSEG